MQRLAGGRRRHKVHARHRARLREAMHAQGLKRAYRGRFPGRDESRTGARVQHVGQTVEFRAGAARPGMHGPEAGVAEGTVLPLPRPAGLAPHEPARTDRIRRHGPARARGLHLDGRSVDLLATGRQCERGRRHRLRHTGLGDGLRVARSRPRRPWRDARVPDEDAPEGVGSVCGSHVLAPLLAGAATGT